MDAARAIDPEEWRSELRSLDEWFEKIGPTLPPALKLQRDILLEQL